MVGRGTTGRSSKLCQSDNTYKKRRNVRRGKKSSVVTGRPGLPAPATCSAPISYLKELPLDLTVANRIRDGLATIHKPGDMIHVVPVEPPEKTANPAGDATGIGKSGGKIRRMYTSTAKEGMPFFTSSYVQVLTATVHRGCQTDLTAPRTMSSRPAGSTVVAAYFVNIPQEEEKPLTPEKNEMLPLLLSAGAASETSFKNETPCTSRDAEIYGIDVQDMHLEQSATRDPLSETVDTNTFIKTEEAYDELKVAQPQLFALDVFEEALFHPTHGQNLAIPVTEPAQYDPVESPESTKPRSPLLRDEEWQLIVDALGIADNVKSEIDEFTCGASERR
jgi:hypothetical protein